ADSFNVAEDVVLTVAPPGVLIDDTDADGDSLTAVLVAGPAHGTLTLNADGSFIYVPGPNFHGIDRFTYHATDGRADSGAAVATTARSSSTSSPRSGRTPCASPPPISTAPVARRRPWRSGSRPWRSSPIPWPSAGPCWSLAARPGRM